MSATTVRRIRHDDADLLRSIRLDALADTPMAFGRTYEETVAYPARYWTDAAAERSAGSLASNFFALAHGHPVGLIGGWREVPERPIVDLVSMWVRPTHRGSPVAGSLVEAVVDWARHNDAEAVELWVVRGNDRAIGFYHKCGFVETGASGLLASDPRHEEIRMRLRVG